MEERLVEAARQARQGAGRLARRLRAERAPTALSPNKIGVLTYLVTHGPASPSEVAAAERQMPQSLTRSFAELERAGLITRTRSEHDGREARLAVTAAGRDAYDSDMAQRDHWLAAALASLTDTEIEVVRLAGRLMDRLADANPGRDKR